MARCMTSSGRASTGCSDPDPSLCAWVSDPALLIDRRSPFPGHINRVVETDQATRLTAV